jgi:Ion channel
VSPAVLPGCRLSGAGRHGLARSGSLAVPGEGVPSPISLPVAIYYSFVTLTTLGYGDIVPRSEVVRGLAIMEAVAWQLCMPGPWSASRRR